MSPDVLMLEQTGQIQVREFLFDCFSTHPCLQWCIDGESSIIMADDIAVNDGCMAAMLKTKNMHNTDTTNLTPHQ